MIDGESIKDEVPVKLGGDALSEEDKKFMDKCRRLRSRSLLLLNCCEYDGPWSTTVCPTSARGGGVHDCRLVLFLLFWLGSSAG